MSDDVRDGGIIISFLLVLCVVIVVAWRAEDAKTVAHCHTYYSVAHTAHDSLVVAGTNQSCAEMVKP